MRTFASTCYKLQVVQGVIPDDRIAHNQFAVTMLETLHKDNEFPREITFSDETIFQSQGR
jgi:hypothetical protein